jgi:hypothetical protein
MKHTDTPKNYKIIAIMLASLLAVMSVLTIGMGIRLAQLQKEIDERQEYIDKNFLSDYEVLLYRLVKLAPGEDGAFSDSVIEWSLAVEAASGAAVLLKQTTFYRKNRQLLRLMQSLYICAARDEGYGLHIDYDMYQKLENTSAYFDDEEATLKLVDLVRDHTVRLENATFD